MNPRTGPVFRVMPRRGDRRRGLGGPGDPPGGRRDAGGDPRWRGGGGFPAGPPSGPIPLAPPDKSGAAARHHPIKLTSV